MPYYDSEIEDENTDEFFEPLDLTTEDIEILEEEYDYGQEFWDDEEEF